MTRTKLGDTVRIRYAVVTEDGEIAISSGEGKVAEFTVGLGNVIPALEQAVIGMSPGGSKIEKVPCEMAFGPYRDELAVEMDRELFDAQGVNIELVEGLEVAVRDPSGDLIRATVREISDSSVKLDANHHLAGKDLILEVELVDLLSGSRR